MEFKNWLVSSVAFGLFVYFMIFLIVYTIKIGGSNVNFFTNENPVGHPQSETEKLLRDISKNFGRGK